jgi:hypothetical protein
VEQSVHDRQPAHEKDLLALLALLAHFFWQAIPVLSRPRANWNEVRVLGVGNAAIQPIKTLQNQKTGTNTPRGPLFVSANTPEMSVKYYVRDESWSACISDCVIATN